MRQLLLLILASACLATTAGFAGSAHAAQGVNLRWDACLGDGGTLNKNFACDTNAGSEQMFVSFEMDSAFTPVTGLEFSLIFDTPVGLLGSWWQFKNLGTCRQTALSVSATPLAPSAGCADLWHGLASGGLAAFNPNYNFAQTQVTGVFAVAVPVTVLPGTEYFALRFSISHAKTVGTGACAGCLEPVCMGIEYLKLTRPVGVGNLYVATETQPTSSVASWQGSPVTSAFAHYENPFSPNQNRDFRVVACQPATVPVPARSSTWGSIKSLYR